MSSTGLEVNVLDLVDRDVSDIENGLSNKTNQIIRKYGGMCNGVSQMTTDICDLARSTGRVKVLRIWSHGFPGGQSVSTGTGGDPTGQRAVIALGNLPVLKNDLARLASAFEPGGRVELHGCSVGSGDDGIKFLQALAGVLRVDVLAALDGQDIGPLQWRGPVLQVKPSGHAMRISGPPIK